MSTPESPTIRVADGGCLRLDAPDGPKNGHVLVAHDYYDFTKLIDRDGRKAMCASCGAMLVVDDRTYAAALLADAAYLRSTCGEGEDGTDAETGATIDFGHLRNVAAEWESYAAVIAPDERQLGLGVGERS